MLIINLLNYTPLFKLIGDDQAQIVKDQDKNYLLGNFLLLVNLNNDLQQSATINFQKGQARVELFGSDWQLTHLIPSVSNEFLFLFTDFVSFSGADDGPWCRAKAIKLVNLSNVGIGISLKLVQFSLDPSKDYHPGTSALIYFTGNNSANLSGKLPAGGGSSLDFFLENFEDGFSIDCGVIIGASGLNIADFGTQLTISANTAAISFDLKKTSGLNFASYINFADDRININLFNTGLALESSGFAGRFHIAGSKLIASAKSLSIINFQGSARPDETYLAISKDKNPHLGNKTRVFTSTDRLEFHYPLPDKAGNLEKNYKPQFVYSDRSLAANDNYNLTSRRESYYGIQVQDILSDKNAGQARLDANFAVFDFDRITQSFSLKAGTDDIYIKGQKTEGCLLVPKQDHANRNSDRNINIPAGELMLIGQYKLSEYSDSGSISPLSLDTSSKVSYFSLTNPVTQMQPIGISSKVDDGQQIGLGKSLAYSKWQLSRKDGNAEMFALDAGSGIIQPQHNWIENYETQYPETTHQFLTNPGSGIQYDPNIKTGHKDTRNFTKLTISTDGILVYSAFSAGLIYAWLGQQDPKKNQIYLKISSLSPSSPGVKDLKAGNAWIRFDGSDSQGNSDPAARAFFKQFIDSNKSPGDDKFELRVQPDMGFVLWQKNSTNPDGDYCYEKMASTVIFDYSSDISLEADSIRSWTSNTLAHYKNESPELWLGGVNGSGMLDPSIKAWKGFFFTNLPFNYEPVDKNIIETINKYWLLQALIKFINNNMIVSYGWMDEKAATFVAGFASDSGISLCQPTPFGKMIDFIINSVGVKVRQNTKPTGIELNFALKLGIFNDYILNGVGSLSFSNGKAGLIRLYPEVGKETIINPFPGFDKLIVNSFETDFSNAKLYFKAVPDPSLAATLPIFSVDKPISGLLIVDLNDQNATTVTAQLTLDSEKNSYFGSFPITILGITITFKYKGSFDILVDIHCKFNVLGQVFSGHIKLSKAGLFVELEELNFDLDFGEAFHVRGNLNWTDNDLMNIPSPLPYDGNLAGKASNSTFSGALSLKSDFLLSGFLDGTFLFKTGSYNKMPYFIGAYSNSGSINLGIAKINKPTILIANGADFDGNQLTTMAGSVAKDIFGALRPPGDAVDTKWIQRWKANTKIGLTLAGSGFMNFGDVPLTGSPSQNNNGLSSLYFSSGGIFRIDAVIKVFGMDLTVAFAINKINQRISVGVKLPKFSFPDESDPQFIFSPGMIVLEWSYGSLNKYFMLSAAFPELEAEQVLRRNWDNAFKIYVRDMPFPLPNTGWAGFKFKIDNSQMIFATALKVGWTGQGSFLVLKYSFEISFGSVIIYSINFANQSLEHIEGLIHAGEEINKSNLENHEFDIDYSDELFNSQFLNLINEALVVKHGRGFIEKIALRAETFGTIKGSASAVLFGVSIVGANVDAFAALVMCGDTDQGITYLGGVFQFSLSVQVLCFTYTVGFDFPLNVIGDPSKCIS